MQPGSADGPAPRRHNAHITHHMGDTHHSACHTTHTYACTHARTHARVPLIPNIECATYTAQHPCSVPMPHTYAAQPTHSACCTHMHHSTHQSCLLNLYKMAFPQEKFPPLAHSIPHHRTPTSHHRLFHFLIHLYIVESPQPHGRNGSHVWGLGNLYLGPAFSWITWHLELQ